jgi:hypothetical protein
MSDDQDQLKRLMRQAVEEAFQLQIGHLYKIYLTNAPTVDNQREYTRKGIENAIAAYRLALAVIEEWEG